MRVVGYSTAILYKPGRIARFLGARDIKMTLAKPGLELGRKCGGHRKMKMRSGCKCRL